MARTTLTKTTARGEFGTYSANSADLTMTAADASNGNQFLATGKDLLIAHNTGAGARTVTVQSVADEKGRTGNIGAYSLGAGEYGVIGVFTNQQGFKQTDGYIYVDGEHAEVKLGVVALP